MMHSCQSPASTRVRDLPDPPGPCGLHLKLAVVLQLLHGVLPTTTPETRNPEVWSLHADATRSQESEGISRSLRELCLRATIQLPPELEGAVEAQDAKLSTMDLGLKDPPKPAGSAGPSDAAPSKPADPSSQVAAPVPTSQPAPQGAVLAAVAVPAPGQEEPSLAAAAGPPASAGLPTPIVVSVVPAPNAEAGDPQAIASAATAAATAVLSQVCHW